MRDSWERFGYPPDFEARLHFLTKEEGGLSRPPMPGYRSDLRYPDHPEDQCVWMVWPLQFFTDEGVIPAGQVVPHDVFARFWIISRDLRDTIHRPRLRPGVAIEIVQGNAVVATGEVTELVALALNR